MDLSRAEKKGKGGDPVRPGQRKNFEAAFSAIEWQKADKNVRPTKCRAA